MAAAISLTMGVTIIYGSGHYPKDAAIILGFLAAAIMAAVGIYLKRPRWLHTLAIYTGGACRPPGPPLLFFRYGGRSE